MDFKRFYEGSVEEMECQVVKIGSIWGHSCTWLSAGERSIYPLRSSEDDPKTRLNQHQSLSGEILPQFDINNKGGND